MSDYGHTNDIQQVLAHIPPEVIGQTRTVESWFFGPESLLKKLRTWIRRKTAEAVCELDGEALRVVQKLEVTLPLLARMDEA
jgi:actin-like ATPase involved in cell morphogenesis